MNRDELKEKLAKQLYEWIDDDGWEWEEVDEASRNVYRVKAAAILSLIDSQRCVWEHDSEGDWRTGCKAWYAYDYSTEDSFCPCCGHQIEVKDEQG